MSYGKISAKQSEILEYIKKEILNNLGYEYVALGHIHKPQTLVENRMVYAGALEPIDKNDVGPHGYVKGEITDEGVIAAFVPKAKREYIHLDILVDENMTNGALKDQIRSCIQKYGLEHIYKFRLQGFRDTDIQFELESTRSFGNIIEMTDETKPAYDFDKLLKKNQVCDCGKVHF